MSFQNLRQIVIFGFCSDPFLFFITMHFFMLVDVFFYIFIVVLKMVKSGNFYV